MVVYFQNGYFRRVDANRINMTKIARTEIPQVYHASSQQIDAIRAEGRILFILFILLSES